LGEEIEGIDEWFPPLVLDAASPQEWREEGGLERGIGGGGVESLRLVGLV
jgi:hypothetical protein